MAMIKGPIVIKKGNVKQFLQDNLTDLEVALPFKATNFRCANVPEGVKLKGQEIVKGKPITKEELQKKKLESASSVPKSEEQPHKEVEKPSPKKKSTKKKVSKK